MPATGPIKDANKKQLTSVFRTFEVPEFVKSASIDEYMGSPSEKCAGLDDYPIGEKASAWVSAAYFINMDKDAMDEGRQIRVEKNLRKAAEAYGFDYDEMEKEAEAADYEEEADIPYALSVEVDGEAVDLCPIPTEAAISKAAEWVYENRSSLPFEFRKEAALNMMKRAKELEAGDFEKRSYIEKAAGIGVGDPQEVADSLRSRGAFIDDEEVIGILNKAADKYEDREEFNLEEHEKVADLVAAADEASGIQSLYEKEALKTPEELLYKYSVSEIEKEAGDLIDLSNGMAISELQLKRADFNTLAGVLGEDFADKCSSADSLFPNIEHMKEAVKELDEDEADDLVSLLPDDNFMRSLPNL